MRESFSCASLFALPNNAGNRKSYIMISMDDVAFAFKGFCLVHFLLGGKVTQ